MSYKIDHRVLINYTENSQTFNLISYVRSPELGYGYKDGAWRKFPLRALFIPATT